MIKASKKKQKGEKLNISDWIFNNVSLVNDTICTGTTSKHGVVFLDQKGTTFASKGSESEEEREQKASVPIVAMTCTLV